jgi:23S rRNA pseudouridine1911/1915/1917 synthase
MAVHKPAGILSHPNHPGQKNTLVHGLLHLGRALSSINGVLRPGIVHRLDRETSGVMLIARTDRAHRALQDAFARREIKKVYFALSYGRLDQLEGEIQLPLGRHPKKRHLRQVDPKGRDSWTRFKVIRSWDRFHFIRLEPLTGRTHQIRVHLKSRGMPILHDLEYAGRPISKWVQRLQLHAFSIKFTHPINGEPIFVRSPLERDMIDVVRRLNRGETYVQ